MSQSSMIDNGDTRVVTVDATAGNETVTLRKALRTIVVRVDSSGNTVTIRPFPNKTLDGVKDATTTLAGGATRAFTWFQGGWQSSDSIDALSGVFLDETLNLTDTVSASAARSALGLSGAAVLAVGTSSGTVAAGDDSRITGAAQKASNLSDLASAGTARTNLGLGAAAVMSTAQIAADSALTGTYAGHGQVNQPTWRPITRRACQIGQGQSNGTDTSGNYRTCHQITNDALRVRLVYANHYGAAGAALGNGTSSITVNASVEAPVAAPQAAMSAVTPVTFGGAASVVIAPGAIAVSDPIAVPVTAGQYLYSTTYVVVAASGRWPVGQQTAVNGLGAPQIPNLHEGGATGAPATDTTAGGTPPTGFVSAFFPVAVLGNLALSAVGVQSVGDSLMLGANEPIGYFAGWLDRACAAAGVGLIPSGHSGEQAAQVQDTAFAPRTLLAPYAGATVIDYGRNDLANIGSITLATFQGYMINLYLQAWRLGKRVHGVTITPITSSTDGFITTANQTTSNTNAYETNRVAFNAWLRDGAPMTSAYVQVATGASTGDRMRIGNRAHPLRGFIDKTAAVESGFESGKWKAAERVVTDCSITSGTRNLSSATAAFTNADIGKSVYIGGAGAAGAALISGVISTVTNGTTATYESANPSSATATNQNLAIGYYTTDGTHPTVTGYKAIAAIVNPKAL